MRLLAPAKLNLHLRVGPRRQDGFHPLLTWMCTVALFDRLSIVERAPPGIELTCDRPDLACNEANLVMRAAQVLEMEARRADSLRDPLKRADWPVTGVAVRLEKRIPIGAGLGGGSSDAARVLLGLNRLWRRDLSDERLSQLAAQLGSDVPFFLREPAAVCRGRGEQVDPAPVPAARWAVVVLPPFGLSTAEVYRRFDEMMLGQTEAVEKDPPWHDWATLPAERLLGRLENDLEPAAFALQPVLAELRRRIERLSGRPVRMSGSGSSLFTLFEREGDCHESAARIAAEAGVQAIPLELGPEIDDDLNAPRAGV